MKLWFFTTENLRDPETGRIVLWAGACYEPAYLLTRAEEVGFDTIKGVTIVASNIDAAQAIYRLR